MGVVEVEIEQAPGQGCLDSGWRGFKAIHPPETEFGEVKVAIHELEKLKGELQELSEKLKSETRIHARWIILQRAQEIMQMIREGLG